MKEDNILKGIAAAPGITIAKAYLYTKQTEVISSAEVENTEEAVELLNEALSQSRKELQKVFSLAVDKLGVKRAAIFEAQIMILDDPVLIDTIIKRIQKEKKTPEYIVDDEISKYQKLMEASDEAYMKERSHDIEDIKNRIIKSIKKKKWKSRITEDVIVVSPYLTPADTILFSRINIRGFITDFGGLTSHTAIVARSLHIPAVVGVHDATSRIKDGDHLIVDGYHGTAILNPTEKQLEYYRNKIEQIKLYDEELAQLKELPAETLDGKKIHLSANLDLNEEIGFVIQNGAEGIGLVRTEQILQEFEAFPDEETQYKIYSDLAEKLYPKVITIRALDLGGDKVLPFDVKEPNPFLGWRGIRFLLDNRELFKTQTNAILRSGRHKNVKYMIPMVSSVKEIRQFMQLIEECKEELDNRGIEYDKNMKIGIMVEVPSAAVMAELFAREVDFFSIGTNDLIQYLLAVDRGNEIVSDQYQEFHPAVIRTLAYIVRAGKISDDFEISICGEMAADPVAVPLLIGLGLDSISASASVIPTIKKIIRSMNYSEVKEIAEECLHYTTENEINEKMMSFYKEKLSPEIFDDLIGNYPQE